MTLSVHDPFWHGDGIQSLISEQIVEKYQKDGAILLSKALPKEWLPKIEIGIKKNLAKPSIYSEKLRVSENEGAYFNDYFNWREIEEFSNLVQNSPMAETAGQLMKSSKRYQNLIYC